MDRLTAEEPVDSPESDLAAGDVAAANGRWPDAIAAWERALSGSDSTASAARIRWFLTQRDIHSTSAQSDGQKGRALVAGGLAPIGTACVFLAESASEPLATVLSLAAWIAYIATIVLVLLYARRSDRTRDSKSPPDPEHLQRARTLANRLAETDPTPHIRGKLAAQLSKAHHRDLRPLLHRGDAPCTHSPIWKNRQ